MAGSWILLDQEARAPIQPRKIQVFSPWGRQGFQTFQTEKTVILRMYSIKRSTKLG